MELEKLLVSFLSDKYVSQALQQNLGNSINSEEKKNSLSEKGIWVIVVNFSEILIKGKAILFELAGNLSDPSSS